MAYEIWDYFKCNKGHRCMEYIGDGNYRCSECGETYHDCDFDLASDEEYEDESISVNDAALIWASHGMDEDYTFGYSAEELKNAL